MNELRNFYKNRFRDINTIDRFNAADKVMDNKNILILYLLRLKDGEGGGEWGRKGRK